MLIQLTKDKEFNAISQKYKQFIRYQMKENGA